MSCRSIRYELKLLKEMVREAIEASHREIDNHFISGAPTITLGAMRNIEESLINIFQQVESIEDNYEVLEEAIGEQHESSHLPM